MKFKSCRAMMVATLATLACTASAALSGTGHFERLKYNTPGTSYLKSGLFSHPLVFDYDGDGDLDLVIHCTGKDTTGEYLFENLGKRGQIDTVFAPPRRLGPPAGTSAQTLPDGRVIVTDANRYTHDFRAKGFRDAGTFAGLPANVHTNGVRGNVWRLADLDGDGRNDLVVGVGDWKEYGWHNQWDEAGVWKKPQVHGLFYTIRNETGADGVEKWGKPEILRLANGMPVDVYGSGQPLFADWDGDGDLDLLTADFVDHFTYFENIGTVTELKLAAGRPILDKFLRPIKAELCLVTSTVADWDEDGHPDFIVCEEDGRVALIRHAGRLAMGIPVFENARFFRQRRDDLGFGILNTPFAVDWDGDGDQDLVCGNSAGFVGFVENLSGPGVAKPKWAEPKLLEADGAPIRILAGPNGSIQGPVEEKWGYTCLSVSDWDGDGLPDIMLNSIRGEIVWCRNIGTRTAPRLAPPEGVAVAWEGTQPELKWGWRKPFGSKNILTQWRTTPYMIDFDRDGLTDLVLLDTEGYLCLWRRARRDGRLVLLPPERCFVNERGEPLRLNANSAGGSGRRKFCFANWTNGKGGLDLIVNSKCAALYAFLRREGGKWYYAMRGDLDDRTLAGHTTSPTACDFDADGRDDILLGAESGFFYLLKHP